MARWQPLFWVALAVGLSAASPAAAEPSSSAASCAEARDSQRLAAEKLVRAADSARGERARVGYRDAANGYLLVWQTYLADPCRGAEPSCARAEEVLYNASRAFRAAHEVGRASEVSATLLDPQFHLHETALAKKSLRDEGVAQQALTEYANAAGFYERFAKALPQDEHAAEALLDAIVLRLTLHEERAAEQNAELWTKLYSAKSAASHANVVVAIALSKRDGGASPRELEAYLSSNRAVVAQAQSEFLPTIDVVLGTAIAARGDLGAARPHFERAAAFDVQSLLKRLENDDRALADRRLAKALIGIGDARLWLSDQARDVAMKLSLRKLDAESLTKKRAAVAAAETEYAKVLAIQPVPPPNATVESAARVARMRGQLWAQAHLAFGAEPAEPMLAEAKAAHRSCVELSLKLLANSRAAARCATWLARHYPDEHAALAEIIPQPKWSGSRFAMPRPLDEDGEELVFGAPRSARDR